MATSILISGGSKGLGKSIIENLLLSSDACITTFSRNPTNFIIDILQNPDLSNRFLYKQMDVSNINLLHSLINEARSKFGGIDILINNAAIAADGILAIQNDQDISKMIEINISGTISLTKLCIREMLPKKWGRIINISSIVGLSGYKGLSVYSFSKAGMDGFTRSLARELGNRGITVNSISPGFIETDMSHGLSKENKNQIIRRTPVGRLGYPNDIIPMIKFLISKESEFITGQTIVIDGGLTA